MTRDSHTPIQVDIPGPKCLPPGLSLKNKIFGSNIGYEVRAVSYFLMIYCKKNIVFSYGIVLAQLFLYFSARFRRTRERPCMNRGRSLLSMRAMLLGCICELRPNSRALDQL